jgi:ribosomal protein S18 acetylase RimI-like enzyme
MSWTFATDVEAYARHAGPLLAADPIRNTGALTVVDWVRAGRYDRNVFGWYADPAVRGAVSWTPPYKLMVGVVPDDTVDALVTGLRAYGADLPGVTGEIGIARRIAAAWTAGTELRAETTTRLRLYALGDLVLPDVPGHARLATAADLVAATAMYRGFHDEFEGTEAFSAAAVRADVDAGLIWLWFVDGEPVSAAGHKVPAAGVARVGPVYTPPAHRGRGYGSAVTAACSAAIRAAGAGAVLFTDLDNPTSNSIYQKIGYRRVVDREILSFIG